MRPVELEAHEVRHAVLVGVGRTLAARSQHRRPRYVGSITFLGDIVGAVGELVVAKALGVYWAPNVGGNDHATGDVDGLQVRATMRTPPRLPIRETDQPADQVFVLVIGQPPGMSIAGWLRAGDAKRAEWWDDRDHEWKVPVDALHEWDVLFG